jgi:predicted nucleic acid-binding protein
VNCLITVLTNPSRANHDCSMNAETLSCRRQKSVQRTLRLAPSPIINLAAIDRLTLLQQLYGHIIIPQAVYHEIAVTGAGEPGAQEVQRLSWIITHTVADQTLIHSLCVELDRGEAEAIACTSELNAELLLVDEERGRAIAQRLGLRVIGLLGVLIEAKHRGLIDAFNPRSLCTSVTGGWGKSLCYELTAHR